MASDSPGKQIRIPILLWRRVILDLRRRGGGRGESGAFLLGVHRGSACKVAAFICYDDLDPGAYRGGAIAFHAAGNAALWTFCRNTGLEILADVHTHPGGHVGQSSIDQRNPMIPVAGHTAMIVPNYAYAPWWSLESIGVYEYLGTFRWRAHPAAPGRRVALTSW